jgi:alpha-L-fucosidase 2
LIEKALQVDATFGVSAAVSEMLVQSHEGYLHLLPALSDEWSASGRFSGVVTRGAFELDYSWANGLTKQMKLVSRAGEKRRIKSDTDFRITCDGKEIQANRDNDGIYFFLTKRNGVYVIEFENKNFIQERKLAEIDRSRPFNLVPFGLLENNILFHFCTISSIAS